MKLRNEHLVKPTIVAFIKTSEKDIASKYKEYPTIKKFVRPSVTSSEVVETVMRMPIKSDDVMNTTNDYYISDTLYELACIDLEKRYLKSSVHDIYVLKRKQIPKQIIDNTFKEHLFEVQGDNFHYYHAIDRTSNSVAQSIEIIKYDGENLIFNGVFKYYSFDLNHSTPSVYRN
jgi:hypothetical protein